MCCFYSTIALFQKAEKSTFSRKKIGKDCLLTLHWSIGWLWACRKWLNTQKIAIGYIFSLSRQSFAQKHPCLVINKNWFTCIVKRIANPTFISRIFVFELILTHNRVWVLLWLCSHFLIMWLRLIEIGPTEVVEKGKYYLNLWTIRHWQ